MSKERIGRPVNTDLIGEALDFFVKRLTSQCSGVLKIVLFGSYAKGIVHKGSDIDMLVVHAADEKEVLQKVAEAALETTLNYHIPLEAVTFSVHEYREDNAFIHEVNKTGKTIYAVNPQQERGAIMRDYYALALEWLRYAKGAAARGEHRLAIDAGYNSAELAVKALIIFKGEGLASSHGGLIDQFGRLYVLAGEVPREVGRRLHEALTLRSKARYDPRAFFTPEEAASVSDLAEELLKLLEERIYRAGD